MCRRVEDRTSRSVRAKSCDSFEQFLQSSINTRTNYQSSRQTKRPSFLLAKSLYSATLPSALAICAVT